MVLTVKPFTEREFTAQVIQLARLNAWRVAHFRPARVVCKDGRPGWRTPVQGDGKGFPDLLLLRGKTQLAVELKTGRNNCSHEQEEWLIAFRAAGVSAFVWRPEQWDEIEKILELA